MGIELKASGEGIVVDKFKTKNFFLLRGQTFSLISELNSIPDLRQYFRDKDSENLGPSEKEILIKYHPEFYQELIKRGNN